MRKSLVCPKCQGQRFFEIDKMLVPNYEYANSVEPFTLTAAYTETGQVTKGFFGGAEMARIGAEASAFVCAGCGYTEVHARGLDVLEELASKGEGGVRVVDARVPSQGPNR
jgi:predicted nucleic-acid-binding Zn-ribbon protein